MTDHTGTTGSNMNNNSTGNNNNNANKNSAAKHVKLDKVHLVISLKISDFEFID